VSEGEVLRLNQVQPDLKGPYRSQVIMRAKVRPMAL
jgi:hypothetical protein